ncbi:MAG: hypothetical protein AAGU32_03765 [Bacillota bacterium]
MGKFAHAGVGYVIKSLFTIHPGRNAPDLTNQPNPPEVCRCG